MGTASHLLMVKAKHNGYIKVELDERQTLTRLLTSLSPHEVVYNKTRDILIICTLHST